MDKPEFLYHASENTDIQIFEPRKNSFRDPSEGPVIFATPDKTMSSVFIVPANDSWTHSGLFGNVHYFICGDEERFKNVDKGGAIYQLPSATFETDPTKGLGIREWVSKVPVKPLNKEVFESGLEAMLLMGVQVYFVDDEIFKTIDRSSDHGNELMRNTVSENTKRMINVFEIPLVQD